MTYKPVGVRQGLVEITLDNCGRVELKGLPIMGYSNRGQLINRKVLISHQAPAWFTKLCSLNVDNGFKIRVKIVATYEGHLAYAVPVAQSEKEVLNEWKVIRPSGSVSVMRYQYAVKAHEYFASKNNLTIVEHRVENQRIRSIAVNASGEKIFITGGYILGCLKEKIEKGHLDWDTEIKKFIRIREIVQESQPS